MKTEIEKKKVDTKVRVSTLDLVKDLGITHTSLLNLIRKYMKHFKEIGPLPHNSIIRPHGGLPTITYLLNEDQAVFLVLLMKNSKATADFKFKFIREFYRQKKELLNIVSNSSTNHAKYKKEDMSPSEIDEITILEDFIKYKENINKKDLYNVYQECRASENGILHILSLNLPELMTTILEDTMTVKVTMEGIIFKALRDCMAQGMPIEEIYTTIEERVKWVFEMCGNPIKPKIITDEKITYIYFLQCLSTKNIKIGKTKNLKERIRSNMTANSSHLKILKVIHTSETITEQSIHSQFKYCKFKDKYEWFSPDTKLLEFINSLESINYEEEMQLKCN